MRKFMVLIIALGCFFAVSMARAQSGAVATVINLNTDPSLPPYFFMSLDAPRAADGSCKIDSWSQNDVVSFVTSEYSGTSPNFNTFESYSSIDVQLMPISPTSNYCHASTNIGGLLVHGRMDTSIYWGVWYLGGYEDQRSFIY